MGPKAGPTDALMEGPKMPPKRDHSTSVGLSCIIKNSTNVKTTCL